MRSKWGLTAKVEPAIRHRRYNRHLGAGYSVIRLIWVNVADISAVVTIRIVLLRIGDVWTIILGVDDTILIGITRRLTQTLIRGWVLPDGTSWRGRTANNHARARETGPPPHCDF